jgi:hypothetical protein
MDCICRFDVNRRISDAVNPRRTIFACFVERAMRPSASFSQLHQAQVDHDPGHPRRKARIPPERIDSPVGLEQRFLDRIFGVFLILRDANSSSEKALLVTSGKNPERFVVAQSQKFDKLYITKVFRVLCRLRDRECIVFQQLFSHLDTPALKITVQ